MQDLYGMCSGSTLTSVLLEGDVSLAASLPPRDEHRVAVTCYYGDRKTLTLLMHEEQTLASRPDWCGLAHSCIQGEHFLENAGSLVE